MTSAAWASFSDACSSPSAVMTRARRSRSASACRDIDRFIDLGQGDVLDLDAVDVDAPVQRRAVDHQLQALVELLAVGQQVVEVALADDRAQRGLGDLTDRGQVVLDVDGHAHRIGRR